MWIVALFALASPQIVSPVTPPPLAGPPARSHLGWSFDMRLVVVEDWDAGLRIELDEVSGVNADLYVKRGTPPTLLDYDFRATTPGTADELIVVDGTSVPALTSGVWVIGVWRENGTLYHITFDGVPLPSTRAGMGANLFDDPSSGITGTTFRVLAPNAQGVRLRGPFNNWSQSRTPPRLRGQRQLVARCAQPRSGHTLSIRHRHGHDARRSQRPARARGHEQRR